MTESLSDAGETSQRRVLTGTWSTGRLASAVALLAAMVLSYLGIDAVRPRMQRNGITQQAPSSPTKQAPSPPTNPFGSAHGRHLIAYVITASDCGWSNRPEGKAVIASLKEDLHRAHGAEYARITVVGVDIDDNIETGLRFLATFSSDRSKVFDQVMIGGSWLNEQILEFVWREHIAEPMSPQVIALERTIDTADYLNTSRIGVGGDTLVATAGGEAAIKKWARDGYPLQVRKSRVGIGS